MHKNMKFLANKAGGGFNYNGAGTSVGDWIAYEGTDNRYISVCYYAYVAELMQKISLALSERRSDVYAIRARNYETLYNNIKDEFNTRYID